MAQTALKIISVGAAVQDVFLRGKIFTPHRDDGESVNQFVLGSKNNIESIFFSTGGGATNAAVTFARHGFKSSYLGMLGYDVAAEAVIDDLRRDKVDTALIMQAQRVNTGYSILLLAPNGERTILTYRGASGDLRLQTRDFQKAKPDWIYITSLAGDFESLQAVFRYARKHKIKVAINPGEAELKQSRIFKELIPDITILSVNKEEAQMLFRGDTVQDLVRHAANHIPYVIVTDGPRGSMASDGKKICKAGVYDNVPVVDRTGAGDSFSSGFVAKIADGKSLEEAVVFASANSTSVVSQLGAKAGILTSKSRLHSMPVVIRDI